MSHTLTIPWENLHFSQAENGFKIFNRTQNIIELIRIEMEIEQHIDKAFDLEIQPLASDQTACTAGISLNLKLGHRHGFDLSQNEAVMEP